MENSIDQYKIAELIFLKIKGELKEEEKMLLSEWINRSPENKALYEQIINKENIANKINAYSRINKRRAWNKINSKIQEKGKIKKLDWSRIVKYAAAILLPLLIGGYIILNYHKLFNTENVVTNQITPGTQKAILTLESGEKVILENKAPKRILIDKSTTITDTNKTLIYDIKKREVNVKVIQYNILETPKGGEYTLVLSDGSKVWLNAASKLRYPVQFGDSLRNVYLEGEAYFEVTENKTKPFVVNSNIMKVEVLGTSFNIAAYNDENNIKTTLVDGRVKINTTSAKTILIPGYQAVLDKETETINVKEVDVDVYTSWKDGKFMFDNETLEEIMRKLDRWYNIEIEYLNKEVMNYHFSGTLDRYDEISEILNMIALTTNIEFKINGNVIMVDKKKN